MTVSTADVEEGPHGCTKHSWMLFYVATACLDGTVAYLLRYLAGLVYEGTKALAAAAEIAQSQRRQLHIVQRRLLHLQPCENGVDSLFCLYSAHFESRLETSLEWSALRRDVYRRAG